MSGPVTSIGCNEHSLSRIPPRSHHAGHTSTSLSSPPSMKDITRIRSTRDSESNLSNAVATPSKLISDPRPAARTHGGVLPRLGETGRAMLMGQRRHPGLASCGRSSKPVLVPAPPLVSTAVEACLTFSKHGRQCPFESVGRSFASSSFSLSLNPKETVPSTR